MAEICCDSCFECFRRSRFLLQDLNQNLLGIILHNYFSFDIGAFQNPGRQEVVLIILHASVRYMKIDFIKTILEPLLCFQNVRCEISDITKTGVQKSSSKVRHTHRRTFVADTQDWSSCRLMNCRLHKILSF